MFEHEKQFDQEIIREDHHVIHKLIVISISVYHTRSASTLSLVHASLIALRAPIERIGFFPRSLLDRQALKYR